MDSNFIHLDQTKLRPGKYKITAGLQWSDSKGKITSVNSFIDIGEIILTAKKPRLSQGGLVRELLAKALRF